MALMGAENRINNCITLFLPSARRPKKAVTRKAMAGARAEAATHEA